MYRSFKEYGEEVKVYRRTEKKKKSLYDRPMEKVELYQSLLFDEALENRQVFNRKIIGKDDVDLAQLITRLNISDWVQQGYEIVRKNEDVCPFCQQTLPEQFEEKLSSYFDQTYIELIDELNNTTNDYEEKVGFLISQIDSLSKRDTTFINIEKVENLRKLIKAKFDENLCLLRKRRRNLVELLNLLRFQKQLGEVNLEILNANEKVREYNTLIDNARIEKENLNSDIWRFIAEKNKNDFSLFNRKSQK
ncbi:AAA family ATPase [[Brevibacterium] frigoritolerans]|uniref:AAA family ATPase n=1 Tax=Peribacillus frigoritolerans TaxID=450367 RepID=A0A941FIX1_9BACI|nr:AAA family ATPase [Peribacillus frigoritolerans]